jgi:hypothetical protein
MYLAHRDGLIVPPTPNSGVHVMWSRNDAFQALLQGTSSQGRDHI